jgi:hypothetical protein
VTTIVPPPPLPSVRYHCFTAATVEPILGLDYLLALAECSRLQACPIGPAFLSLAPWSAVSQHFIAPAADRYINIVCAPPDLAMGSPVDRRAVAPQHIPGGQIVDSETIYTPSTALSGLFTVGVPNIAITLGLVEPSEPEKNALGRYDLVITPTDTDAEILAGWGVKVAVVPPEPDLLAEILSDYAVLR